MITLQILEDNDIIQQSDWCRPMTIQTINPWSDTYVFTNTYSGQPENNVRWLTAKQCCPAWIGKTVKEFNDGMEKFGNWYEFMRGPIPNKHQYGLTNLEIKEKYTEYLKTTVSQYGKYKENTWYHIKHKDDSYFEWAIRQGILKDIEDDF